ncbi:OmpW family outer membrane protein [uncultured Salinisphaera sp.]|uniref:OmpW/AlkL family protein n=1 Tax=uncultured Salinisphaera sp. TaxID=359372 RepID=UPI0032B12CEF
MIHQNKPARRRLSQHAAKLLGGASLMLLAGTAFAQGTSQNAQTDTVDDNGGVFERALKYAHDNTYYRVGVLHLSYEGDSSSLRIDNANGLAAQPFGVGSSKLEGTGSSVGDKTTLGGTIGMYIPKTGRHLAAEVTLAPPLKLDFEVSGRAIDESIAPETQSGIPTGVPALGRKIGTLKALPPNLTIIYRPWVDTMFQPYIGAGAMYLYTFDTDVTNEVLNAYGNEPTLNLTKPVACVGQVGMDVNLSEKLFVTADVKYVGCAEVEATVNNVVVNAPALSPTVGPVNVGSVSSTNDFKAVLYQVSMGFRF